MASSHCQFVVLSCLLALTHISAFNLSDLTGAVAPRISEATPFASQQRYTISKFRHENCGGSNDLIKIDHLNIAENLLITASVTVNADVVAPVRLELEIAKKLIFTYTKVPCISNFGSCNYEDVCAALATQESCHPQAAELGLCKCPFSAGSYAVKDLDLIVTFLNDAEIPPILESMITGEFRVTANVKTNGRSLGCATLFFTVHDK